MKKIILVLVLLLGTISLMAQDRYIYGGSVDEGSYVNGKMVGVRAYSRYDCVQERFEVTIVYYGNDDGRIAMSMQGSVSNVIPMYLNESITQEPQTFYYPVNKNGYTRLSGVINFVFSDGNYSTSIPMNVGIDIR